MKTITRYNTPAKIINFKKSVSEINTFMNKLELLRDVDDIEGFVNDFQPIINYLARAESEIPNDIKWKEDYNNLHSDFINSIRTKEPWKSDSIKVSLKGELQNLKSRYISDYLEMHKHFRLGPKAKDRKEKLLSDVRLEAVRMPFNY